MAQEKKRGGRLTLPRKVRDDERAYIDLRRKAAKVRSTAKKSSPLVGIALSGGGIRSATLNLGILQALARGKVLRLADYLCTVSGGGYIGSCLTSLLSNPHESWKAKEGFGVDPGNMPLLDPRQIHHLRKHGDFLILRKGIFKREFLRTVGTLEKALVASLSLFTTVLFMATGAWFLFLFLFGDGEIWQDVKDTPLTSWNQGLRAMSPHPLLAGLLFLLGVGSATLIFKRVAATTPPPPPQTGKTPEDLAEALVLKRFARDMILLILATSIIAQNAFELSGMAKESRPGLLLPAIGFLGAWTAILIRYVRNAFVAGNLWTRGTRSLVAATQGLCLHLGVAFAAIAAFLLLFWWFETALLGSSLTAVLAAGATRLFAKRGGDPAQSTGLVAKCKAALPGLALVLAVPLFLVAALLATSTCLADLLAIESRHDLATGGILIFLAAAAAFVLLGFVVNFNRVSPHYFYRDRLAEAYLQTEAQGADGLRLVRNDYALKMSELHERRVNGKPAACPAPYHLVQCALNLAGSSDLARKNRKSDHFIFSKYYCGSTTTGYVPTKIYREGETKLSNALTISGAAASSAMGYLTSFTKAFALTLFNIRLGAWLANPRRYDPNTVCPPEAALPDAGASHGQPERKPTFWPAYLLREMTACTTAQERLINLSDGGHTGDNIGLYPLFQRRCRLIIAGDGEMDPERAFGSLAAAIRQIFTDENVVVRINVDPVKSGKNHYVVGKIEYPDCRPGNAGDSGALVEDGWLLYLKSSFFDRDEPHAVRSYAQSHGDFPYETTADQFFDDDQFEAYRALGEHIAQTVMRDAETENPTADQIIRWCKSDYELREALRAAGGDETKAAAALKIQVLTLRQRMKRHGLAG